jgi:MIP family channel proteins
MRFCLFLLWVNEKTRISVLGRTIAIAFIADVLDLVGGLSISGILSTSQSAPMSAQTATSTATSDARRPSPLARELAAEFLGTFILIVFGAGVVAQVILSGGAAGNILSIHIAWGLGVTMAIYVAGGISGAHLNPAVTLALAIHRKFSWRKVLPYSFAQLLGAFAAAAFVFLVYHDAFNAFDSGVRQIAGPHGTAGIFATYPQPYLSTFGGFIDQVAGTALLVLLVFALIDDRNIAPPSYLLPVLVGLVVVVIGQAFGFNAGYAINPARDLGPRLFTAMAGWGTEVFRAGHHWWWVPIVGPLLGGILGGYIYDLLITRLRPGTR